MRPHYAAALIAIGSSSPTLAQTLDFSTLPVARSVDLFVSGDVTYDDNVARSNSTYANARGLKPSDTMFTPQARVVAYVPLGRNSVSADVSAAYNFYARNTRLDGEHINGTLKGVADLRVCMAEFSTSYSRRRSDLGDLGVVGDTLDLTSNNFETTYSGGVQLGCGRPVGFRPVAMVNYAEGKNSNLIRRGSNYHSWTYGGGLQYAHPTLGSILLYAGQSDTTFENRDAGGLYPGAEGLKAQQVGVRLRRDTGARLRAEAALYYTDVKTEGAGGGPGFSGMTYSLTGTLLPSDRSKLGFSFERSAVPTLSYNVDYYLQNQYQVDLTYGLTSRLSLMLQGALRDRDYRSSVINQVAPLTDDKVWTAQAALQFARSENLSFNLGTLYEKRTANNRLYDYDDFRATFGVSMRL